MTAPDVTSLRALAEAATVGPWQWGVTEDRRWALIDSPLWPETVAQCADDDNAAFIAAANPTTVLALCDEVERLRAAYDDLEAARLETMDQRNALRDAVARVKAEAQRFTVAGAVPDSARTEAG